MSTEAAQGAENAQPKFNVPDSVSRLASALAGMPGSETIIGDLGKDAVAAGVITEVKAENKPNEEGSLNNDNNQNAGGANAEAAAGNATANAEAAAAADTTANAAVNETVVDEVEDPILGKVSVKVKKSEVIDSFDGLKEFSKKVVGQEINDFKGLQKFMEGPVAKWRADSQKATELQDQVSKYEGIFDSMPTELLNGVKAFFDARSDWKQEILNTSKIDYKKTVDQIPARELVEHYFPGEFEDEDFSAEEKPKALSLAEKASKDKFNIDKKSREDLSAKQISDAKARFAAKETSIVSSFSSLKESFPNLGQNAEKQIKSIMESGDINSIFMNKDGSFKPGAAKAIMLAMYGESTIQKLVDRAAKDAETNANETILTRGADKPRPSNGASADITGNEKVKKEIDQLLGGLNRQKTY